MLLAPKPGQQYRDPATKQLVPEEGIEMDPLNLDVHRAIECGDLVRPPKASKAAPAPKE